MAPGRVGGHRRAWGPPQVKPSLVNTLNARLLFSMELAKTNADVRKLHQEIKKNRWKVSLIDSSQGIDTEERDFGKLQVDILFQCI